MGSVGMAAKLSFLVLLTICNGDLLQAGQRRGGRGFRSEEDIINTRRKLASIMDPRRRHKESIDELKQTTVTLKQ